jgi:fucose permease
MKVDFGLPLDAVGIYLLMSTVGYTLASFFSGQLASRTGFGRFVLLGALVYGVGFLGVALAPSWVWVLVFGLVGGAGSGVIDASLNRFMAAQSSSTLINWLHASYGIGATLAPGGLSFLLSIGQSWRVGFQIMAILQVILVAAFLLTLNRWDNGLTGKASEEVSQPAASASLRETLAFPAVWLALMLFFIYTGAEMTAGQWSYSLFTIGRGISETTAGWWTSLYWASFTIGRMVLGVLIDRFGFVRSLRLMIGGSLVGAALLWWNPVEGVSFAGLALIGFSLAAIFPTLIAITPRLLGNRQAANAIGMQVAFGGLGIAALPWLAGILADRINLEVIGPFIIVEGLVMFLLFELLLRKRIAA